MYKPIDTQTLIKEFHGFHLNSKFTSEKSKGKVNFLDAVVKIKNERLTTEFYSKLVDSSQYLHYNTCYAKDIKNNMLFTLKLR